MDSTTMQAMGQVPYHFYSNAEPKNQKKQQRAMHPLVPNLPSTPVYSRPGSSSCSQPPTLYSNGPSVMTPTGSPHPAHHKPSILLDTDFGDYPYFPSTPPLSTSGSTIGSPKSSDVLQTPMNPMFSGLDDLEAGKDSLEPAENSILDWSSCGSPPMTPVYLQSRPSQAPTLSTNTSDLLSATSCPSLSPSPAPYAHSVSSEQNVDFCDPRNLTVAGSGSSNPTLAPELPVTSLDEEDVKGEHRHGDHSVPSQISFEFRPDIPNGLPVFGDFSDIESEEDFVNSLVDLGEQSIADVGRPRACTGSSVVSLGHGSCFGDEDLAFDDDTFQFPTLPSPPSTTGSLDDTHQDKRMKRDHQKDDRTVAPIMNTAAGDTQAVEEDQPPSDAESGASDSNASGSEAQSAPAPAPTSRRGRKQSLTEDPSKTFVCDLCNRRFRRQEHLKRHYRSLHTQEKPFECNECGKKFSRSDNLAQHARTHGSGAIVMNLIEDGEAPVYDGSAMPAPSTDDFATFGKVLFQIASEVPGSASEASSDDGSEQGKKKRKRSD